MKPFVIYTHSKINEDWFHLSFTRCYGETIEEAIDNFRLYMHDRFTHLNTYNFCIQQLLPRCDFTGYDPIYGILGVHVSDASKSALHTTWDENHV